jgi:hypothetical protein
MKHLIFEKLTGFNGGFLIFDTPYFAVISRSNELELYDC